MRLWIAVLCVAAFAQQQGVDWILQVKNKPIVDVRQYAWSYTVGSGVSGNLGTAGAVTLTFTPCPYGVAGSNTNLSLYISGGTGTAEAVAVTGGTCISGAASGTITATTANTHTAAWSVGSSAGGIPEAVAVLCAGNGGSLKLASGTYFAYATIYVPCAMTFTGDSRATTYVVGKSASMGVFHIVQPCRFEHFEIASGTQQTSGAYGVSVDAVGATDNALSSFEDMTFSELYDAILGVKAISPQISNCYFYNWAHAGIVAADSNTPDAGGPIARGNLFLTSTGLAAIIITNTGGIVFQGNSINGGGILKVGVQLTATTSSGLLVDGNDIENTASFGVELIGTYSLETITNNHLVNFGGGSTTWIGLLISQSDSDGTVSGNVIQGAGTSTSNYGILIQGIGSVSNWSISGNTIEEVPQGIVTSGTISNVTVGSNNFNATTPLVFTVSGAVANLSAPMTFSTLAGDNGSMLYCSDCTVASTCAGSGTGALAKRLNGTWVCN